MQSALQDRARSAIPSATYRLQLNHTFNLNDAAAQVDYFVKLGISHLYLSPIQTARAGSMHGYDVVDHRSINPELGGEPALRRLASACHELGLGLIADIVPNHMAVGGADNPMWLDVLENGPASQYADVFDIEFFPQDPALAGKVVVPVLGEPYGDALKDGKLVLLWDASIGKLALAYGPHRFPMRPEDYRRIAGDVPPENADLSQWQNAEALHDLLEQQNFRLTWWNAAGDIINWRRFFDVNELAALRMEDEAVFHLTHDVILRLYGEGILDGVRVDHVDGLADPAAYLARLADCLRAHNAERPAGAATNGPYIVVEKILGAGEILPGDWPVHGTTGYDFMDQVNAVQHDADGEPVLNEIWAEISGRVVAFADQETEARTEILRGGFAGQLAACADSFAKLAQGDVATRDLTAESFRRALVAFVSHLRRYRSYATGLSASPALDSAIGDAFQQARTALPADAASFDFILASLTGGGSAGQSDTYIAIRRLNQLAAPVAAKAVEDTAFYRYSRLISRNDVGFDAARLALPGSELLESGMRRALERPYAMLTTATHDHKRGEDVRARLAVISELPDLWREKVQLWLDLTAADRPADISPEDAYALLQTIVGSWPIGLKPDDGDALQDFAARLAEWRVKSLREAKQRSSWAAPDVDYEELNVSWLQRLLSPQHASPFLQNIADFVARIAPAGAINGVVQAALRCSWPGIPDLYQGCELWDLSLVDPDNRRPVDYAKRRDLLDHAATDWPSGAHKLCTIARLLNWRKEDPSLFCEAALDNVPIRGERARHVLAFRRHAGSRVANIAVMLHMAQPELQFGDLPDRSWWLDTAIQFGGVWHDAAELFEHSPVYAVPGS
jgi:(1->4)-alpha-D-glucan 1-alpha-D-glucosylmutase